MFDEDVQTNLPAPRLLLVSEDGDCAHGIALDLRKNCYDVDVVATGAAALERYGDYDLILLNLDLADLDGLQVCRRVRIASDVAIVAITRSVDEIDRVLGLKAGADDCIVLPYGVQELLARIAAVLRRTGGRSDDGGTPIQYRDLCIDPNVRQVYLKGKPVETTRKEFDLLHLLASNPDTVLSRNRLLDEVWGGSLSRRTIDTHVNALRNKLGGARWIVTVRGIGYRIGQG